MGSDLKSASALITAPEEADHYCETDLMPLDCNISPIIHLVDSLFYFSGGCTNTLKLFRSGTLAKRNLATYPVLTRRKYGSSGELHDTAEGA